jgi:hypothetical protein
LVSRLNLQAKLNKARDYARMWLSCHVAAQRLESSVAGLLPPATLAGLLQDGAINADDAQAFLIAQGVITDQAQAMVEQWILGGSGVAQTGSVPLVPGGVEGSPGSAPTRRRRGSTRRAVLRDHPGGA